VNQILFLSSSALAKEPQLILAASCSAADAILKALHTALGAGSLDCRRRELAQAPRPT
jgi:hypothetical protein